MSSLTAWAVLPSVRLDDTEDPEDVFDETARLPGIAERNSELVPDELVEVVVSTVKGVIVRVLLAFPAESVTVIVQSEYVPSFKETKVIVLFPEIADVIPDEQEPP